MKAYKVYRYGRYQGTFRAATETEARSRWARLQGYRSWREYEREDPENVRVERAKGIQSE